MEKKSKKSIVIGITSLLIVTLLLLGLTYAYYRTRIIGNPTGESISVISKNLEITYADGSATMNMTGLIEPGFTYEKTFTITNTGDESVTYAVYFEDVVNTFVNKGDVSFEVTCTSSDGETCNGVDATTYPEENTKLVSNTIGYSATSDVVHTYKIKVNYPETGLDQSDDMGKKLEGKVQIYDDAYVVDIEGTIASASDGDYVEINSTPKKSQIVDGTYKLTAVEVGTHTLYVKDKNGTSKGSATLTIEKGTEGVSGSTITINDDSQTAIVNITSISSTLGIEINLELSEWDKATEGTLLYALRTNQPTGSETTIPGKEATTENEARIITTEDDYGTSHVYRGNVVNNYVTYSNMCWRIVRVQGDGSIKLVLADGKHPCGEANGFDDTNEDKAYIANESGTPKEIAYKNSKVYEATGFLFETSNIPPVLSTWAEDNDLDMSQLVEAEWCNDISIANIIVEDEATNATTTQYGASNRLSAGNPTLKCDMEGLNDTKAVKYKNVLGVLTADEGVFAGFANGANTFYNYLGRNASSWTMSPMQSNAAYEESYVYYRANDSLQFDNVTEDYYINPAVVLKSDATLKTGLDYTQDGTLNKPYVIG